MSDKKVRWDLLPENPRVQIHCLLLISLLLYFPFLGARDFWDDENQYAEIVRVMLLERKFALPAINGALWAETPPLVFWAAALISWVTGAVNEWTIRLPSAVSATALILVCYHFISRRFSSRTAFIASLVLATSFLTFHVERHIPVNMPFFLFSGASLFLFMEIVVFDADKPSCAYLAWVLVALGFFTEGPSAVLIPLVIVLLYCAIRRTWKKILALSPFAGGLICSTVCAPWPVYVSWKTAGAWTDAFFFGSSSAGFANPLVDEHEPLYNLPVGLVPWVFFIVPTSVMIWTGRKKWRDGEILFSCLWFLVIPIFTLISDRQHSHYLFLMLIPASLAVGLYLDRLTAGASSELMRLWTDRSLIFFGCVLADAGASAPLAASFFAPAFFWPSIPAAITCLVAAGGIFFSRKAGGYRAVVVCLIVFMVAINLIVQGLILPSGNHLAVRPFAEKVASVIESGAHVGIFQRRASHYFNYYSKIAKIDGLAKPSAVEEFLNQPGPRYVIANDRRFAALRQSVRQSRRVVLAEPRGDRDRWPKPGYWLLLAGCTAECGPVAPTGVPYQSLFDHLR
jgi:4-amino-4-deoxy-L-arabinose transferase-like glycosyltransferase